MRATLPISPSEMCPRQISAGLPMPAAVRADLAIGCDEINADAPPSASTRTASDALLRFKLVTILFIAEVKFLPQLMPRACHRKQLRLVCRRICNLGKPKVVLSLSTKPIRHGNLPIQGRNARTAGFVPDNHPPGMMGARIAEFPKPLSLRQPNQRDPHLGWKGRGGTPIAIDSASVERTPAIADTIQSGFGQGVELRGHRYRGGSVKLWPVRLFSQSQVPWKVPGRWARKWRCRRLPCFIG